MLAEVFACFGYGGAGSAYEGDCEVSQRGQRPCGGARAASILVEGDIADMMQAVFDSPVGAGEGHQALGAGSVGRQACDEPGDLDALAPAGLPSPFKSCDLRETGPVEIADSLAR